MLDLLTHPSLIHPLTGYPLRAVGVRRDGTPIWPILGGAEGDGDGSGGDGAGDAATDGGSGAGSDAGASGDGKEADDKLGDGGKKALAAERTARAEAEKQAKALQKELEELRQKNMSAEEKALADARREGETEATKRANDRIVRAEVKRLAADKLTDVTDALSMDLSKFTVDDDGNVDEAAINAAIDDLIERKPHYAKQKNQDTTDRGKIPAGPADQGSRDKGAQRAKSIEEAVGNAYAAR